MVRKLCIAYDESAYSRFALDYAVQHLSRRPSSPDQIHVVTVLAPVSRYTALAPTAPFIASTALAVSRQHDELILQRNAAEQHAKISLQKVAAILVGEYKVPADNIHLHVLPGIGGASGVGESIVEGAQNLKCTLLVLGTRGMGSFKKSLMSMIGLGSVSDYCVHKSLIPVLVVKMKRNHVINQGAHYALGDQQQQQQAAVLSSAPQGGHLCHHESHSPAVISGAQRDLLHDEDTTAVSYDFGAEAWPPPLVPAPKTVMVAVDGSPQADHALSWCLVNVLQPQDHLHLIAVAVSPSVPVLDEPAAVAAMELQHYSNEVKASIEEAQAVVRKAMEMSERHGVLHSKLVWTALNPQYGNSNMGEAMCGYVGYVNEKDVDLVVIGSRGLGAWKKLWLDIVDLGSVSDYVAKHVDCPFVVVKCESSDASPHFHPPAATTAVINSSSSAERRGITGAGVHAAEEGEEQLLSLTESGSLLPRVDEEQLPMVRPDLSPAAAAATASVPPAATTATPLEPAPTVPPVVATASILPDDPLSIHEMDGNRRPAAAAAKDSKNCTPATPTSHKCEAGVAMRAHEMGALKVSEPPDPAIATIAPDTAVVRSIAEM